MLPQSKFMLLLSPIGNRNSNIMGMAKEIAKTFSKSSVFLPNGFIPKISAIGAVFIGHIACKGLVLNIFKPILSIGPV
ncbi:MAG: hypothetical protein CTY16_14365 [Methylobacter sp.]|nr:MAG: hypothetical protein CTY16_14365 [Methylobacter sp.]